VLPAIIYLYTNQKAYLAFNFNSSIEKISRSQAGTYTVKVVVSHKWCKADALLQQTINRQCNLACRIVPFTITLSLKLIHQFQDFLNASIRTFVHFSTCMVVAPFCAMAELFVNLTVNSRSK